MEEHQTDTYDITLPELTIEDRGFRFTSYAINAFLLLGLTAIIAGLIASLVFGVDLSFVTNFFSL